VDPYPTSGRSIDVLRHVSGGVQNSSRIFTSEINSCLLLPGNALAFRRRHTVCSGLCRSDRASAASKLTTIFLEEPGSISIDKELLYSKCSRRNTWTIGLGDPDCTSRTLADNLEFRLRLESRRMFLQEHLGTCFAHRFTPCTALLHCFEG